MRIPPRRLLTGSALLLALCCLTGSADSPIPPDTAKIDGTGPGWRQLTSDDFENVNCYKDTWQWKDDGSLHCTGRPVGVCRLKKPVTDFELVLEWRHNRRSGNSGVFVWTPAEALARLKPNQLPSGIEVQILDHGYAEDYQKQTKKKPEWFTTNGDVFRVGKTKFKPFPPVSPDGSRSFPKKNTTKGFGQWNHYYIRAVDGEVRLWVNGEQVSGGRDAEPRTGYLCLESEGSPIDFKNIRIRELPSKK